MRDPAEKLLAIAAMDPRHADARTLIAALSRELAERYDLDDDGSGNFNPHAGVGERGVFLIGYVAGEPIACGAIRPLREGHPGVGNRAEAVRSDDGADDHVTDDHEAEDDVAELKRMYVAPEHRGHGHSRAMLAALEAAAVELAYCVIRLETGDRQTEAIGLYERAGYRRIPKFGIYVDSARSICFEKQVAAR